MPKHVPDTPKLIPNMSKNCQKIMDSVTVGPWVPGTVGPWDLGTLGPWDLGTLGPWDLGTLGPWDPGTLGPPSHLPKFLVRVTLAIILFLGRKYFSCIKSCWPTTIYLYSDEVTDHFTLV